MITKRGRAFIRLLCICLILITSLSLFTGCKSHALSPEKQALKVVGTVGDYEVNYEELYFLANSYKTDGMTEDELWELISENIIANYAILTLCNEVGVEYSEDELEDGIQAYVDSTVESDFGGKRGDYIDALEESYMTDHYVRFIARVDLLYSGIEAALAKSGEIVTDDEDIIAYVKKNFVRTWHLMIANNDGDDVEKNLENAESSLKALKDGSTSMYKLIGGALNEDLLIPSDGYAFARGSMEKAYEDAAFALEVGEYSDVISAKGELGTGEYVDCYYVIQRLALDDEYINDKFSTLYDSYADSVIAAKLDEVKETLEFKPNDYAKSLDVTALEKIDAGTDVFTIVIVCICVGVAVLVAVAVILTVKHFKKKKAALLADKAKRALRQGGNKNAAK